MRQKGPIADSRLDKNGRRIRRSLRTELLTVHRGHGFSMDPLWQIKLFGWLRAVPGTPEGAGDRVVSRFRTRKAEALLAYLAYYAHRSHPREQMIETLW